MVEQIQSPLVSFVLPAYNEGKIIEDTLQRLNKNFENNQLPYEIVVVDDGSLDNTRSKALCYSIDNNRVKVIGYNKNVGKGFAINKGFKEAHGASVIFFDSDADIDAKQVQKFLAPLKYGDIVIGSKWHPNSHIQIPLARKILSHGFNLLARILTGIKISDTQTGIKAIKRVAFLEVFNQLCVKRYAFDVELLLLAKIHGLKVIEVPVDLKINQLFSFKNSIHMFIDLLGIAYRLRIRKWYYHKIS